MALFAPFSYMEQRVVEAPVGPTFQVRTDAYASSIKLAMPFTEFSTLGMSNYYDSIDAEVRGTGTNYPIIPSGSGGGLLFASSSVNDRTYTFTDDGYTTSVSQENSQNIGVITTSAANIGSNSFVFEFYMRRCQNFTNPPFHSLLFGEISGDYLTCQYTTGNVFRFFVNANNSWSTTPSATLTLDTWYHVAYVKSGTNVYVYLNGSRIGVGTRAASVNNAPAGYWNILGVNSGNNNDGLRKNVQDFKLYVGTDKGYTGTTITEPNSIVEEV